MRQVLTAVVLVALVAIGAGCQDKKLEEQNQQLTEKNKQLQLQVTQLQSRPDPARLQTELAARDAKIKDLEEKLKAGQAPGLEGLDTTYDPKAGTLTVNLQGDILFDSGFAVLKPSAIASLKQIVAALQKEYVGKNVRVEGHTDTDPINHTKAKWLDNLDLSLNRAAAVTRYLEKNGVEPKRLTTSGFGDTHPQASKDKSRRVEIVVVVKQ